MPVFMDRSPLEHPRKAKQITDRPSKIYPDDTDGKGCTIRSAVSTVETLPTLSDLPRLSHTPGTDISNDGHDWDEKESSPDDTNHMGEVDAYEYFSASECSSDEGRLCEINYTDFGDEMLSDPLCSGFNDPLVIELPSEPIPPKSCTFLKGLNQNHEVGKVQEGCCRSSEDEKGRVLFRNRLRKITVANQDTKEDLEVQRLAKVSIMTQIAQHADQAKDPFTPGSKDSGRQFSVGPSFGLHLPASADDLNFDYGRRPQVTSPLRSHSRSLTLKHGPVDLPVLVEALEMNASAGPPGRALRKAAQHAN